MKLFQKLLLALIIIITFSCSKEKQKPNLPLHNKKVLILGNSITQNGTYVDFLEYYLRKSYPKETLDITSIGLSGETISGDSEPNAPYPWPCIHSRLDKALQLIKPDLVISCYGMNDGIYSEKDVTRFNNYKNGIIKLIKKVKAANATLIILTPTPFDPNPVKANISFDGEAQSYQHPYYKYGNVLFDYSNWLQTIDGINVIDLNTYLSHQLVAIKTQKADSTFIPDGVHPNPFGHFYMAKKILSDLYPKIQINEATSEIKHLKTDSLFITVSNRRKIRSEGWLNYIGYTARGNTVKSEEINTTLKKIEQLDAIIKQLQK